MYLYYEYFQISLMFPNIQYNMEGGGVRGERPEVKYPYFNVEGLR